MRDYWLVQYLLAAVGWSYIIVVLIATALALKLPKSKQAKVFATVIVIGLSAILPLKGYQGYHKEQQEAQAYKARLDKAQALFAERCKTAGEKIYRTVDGVEGVLLMKIRPDKINLSDQYAMDDPFGADCHGKACIEALLRISEGANSYPQGAAIRKTKFNWVEAVDTSDNQLYRYVGVTKFHPNGDPYFSTVRTRIELAKARFGITYDDISTREDREQWIAGGSLKVIDLATQETIAERVGFMMDVGLGNTSGFRSSWAYAYDHACPQLPTTTDGHAVIGGRTQKFVFSVLHSPIEK
jgi:hypothetical protein